MQDAFGFDVASFLRKVKSEVTVGKVRLELDGNDSKASAVYEGNMCVIHLPTRDAIKRIKGFDDKTVHAKQKAGLIEELCHCSLHEAAHDDKVVGCTVSMMQKHLTSEELAITYIQEKISRLKRSLEIVEDIASL